MEPTTEQITEFLRAMAEMKADIRVTQMDVDREEMRAIMKVHHKEMMAIFSTDQGETKANPEKMVENPEEIESKAEHQGLPKEDAAVETGKGPNYWHRDRHPAEKHHGQPVERTW
jgi:hypothetical protein